jgi:hypothetical protein
MSAVNLGIGRIVIILALIGVGVAVLAEGFDGSAAPATGGSGSPSVTEGPTGPTGTSGPTGDTGATQTPAPNTTGVTFIALNGTDTTGAGAAAQLLLEGDGYVSPVDAADSPVKGVTTTTIYYRPGNGGAQNKADAAYINQHYFDGKGEVAKLDLDLYGDVVPHSATIVLVVGSDVAENLVAGT